MNNDSWLDALTDGKTLRYWLALFANFWLALAYVVLISVGYTLAINLAIVLIGIPLLMFMLASTRTLARMDRRLMATILDVPAPEDFDDLNLRGANFGERLGMLLGSGVTWRSLLYLVVKFPISILALLISMVILIPLLIELFILAPLTIDLHLISVRTMRWLALGLYKVNNLCLPKGKTKRASLDRERLEIIEDDPEAEPRYYIDDEGEIAVAKRGR